MNLKKETYDVIIDGAVDMSEALNKLYTVLILKNDFIGYCKAESQRFDYVKNETRYRACQAFLDNKITYSQMKKIFEFTDYIGTINIKQLSTTFKNVI